MDRDAEHTQAVTAFRAGAEALQSADFSASAVHSQRAMQLSPKLASVRYLAGGADLGQDDFETAVECLKGVCELEPENSRFGFRLGVAVFHGGDAELARVLRHEYGSDEPGALLVGLSWSTSNPLVRRW